MTAPDQLPNNRAHIHNQSNTASLRLGDTPIIFTINASNETLARYGATVARINAELDATGRMVLSRAWEITREVFKEHRRELDDRP